MSKNPSILSHVSLGTRDMTNALAFYEAVLPTLAIRVVERVDENAVAFGRAWPEFWLVTPENDDVASVGNGTHVGFHAASRADVDAFHAAALRAGGTDLGAPGPRPHYGEPYYGCFIADLDGHKIEAAFWDDAMASSAQC